MFDSQKRVEQFWNAKPENDKGRRNWWSSERCVAYQNELTCGKPLAGLSAGCRERLRNLIAKPLQLGISVGCGIGTKEQELVVDGLVQKMELWELSRERIRQGEERVEKAELSNQIQFHAGDAFVEAQSEEYDLVYWDHSLHHMSDVKAALKWSFKRLRRGGILLVNDYCGPNRLQWRSQEVSVANRTLLSMQAKEPIIYRKPRAGNFVSQLRMRWKDPSEAPQSELIPDAILATLGSGAKIDYIGGAMLNILGPLVIPVTAESSAAIDELIAQDRQCREFDMSHFFFMLWQKP